MEYKIKNVLVHSDFLDNENSALRSAIAIAKRHNAQLHLMSCLEFMQFPNALNPSEMLKSELYDFTQRHLKALKATIEQINGISVKSDVEIGRIHSSINKYVRNKDIDLVVVNTDCSGRLAAIISNTYSLEIIEKIPCPVLTVPTIHQKYQYDSILYPLRNVEGVIEKYDYVKPIINANESSLHLLGVYKTDKNRLRLAEKLNYLKKVISSNNQIVSYETTAAKKPSKAILNKANEGRYDLLVVNATFDKKWYNPFSVNFSEQMVNFSKIPVLFIKSGKTFIPVQQAVQNDPITETEFALPQTYIL